MPRNEPSKYGKTRTGVRTKLRGLSSEDLTFAPIQPWHTTIHRATQLDDLIIEEILAGLSNEDWHKIETCEVWRKEQKEKIIAKLGMN
jgi:hypothetical protein